MDRLVMVMGILGLAGCSLLQGKQANDALDYVNRGIALVQCTQKAIKTTDPEGQTQACTTKWLGELPPAVTVIAADYARCARLVAQTARTLPAEDRLNALVQGGLDCSAQYVNPLIAAIQAARKQ